ncbi:MAG: sigma 54-interacting transcriptional regulator [Deltaproteobacteria bacterium]|nr:sigma 54-interacting transcriptional regulator [Deltaproteobacteria bacterium]
MHHKKTTLHGNGRPESRQGRRDAAFSARSNPEHYLKNYLEQIMEASFDGIVISDPEGEVLFANKAYLTLSGIQKEEVVGQNLGSMIQKGLLQGAAVFEVTKTRMPTTRIHSYRRTGRDAMVTGNPVFDEEGNLIYVVANFRDITQLRSLEEKMGSSGIDRLYPEKESLYLKPELAVLPDYGILVRNRRMKEILQQAIQVARYDTDVLILGQSGVGKSKMAQIIHQASPRAKRPFISLNCASIPENLLESELFGYEGGAFTGARVRGKPGQFELASSGTLVLEEIGELSLGLQVKLLSAIEEKQILKIGGTRPLHVDTRIIAITNQDLKALVAKGDFRKDLYFRLNIIPIVIPSLRERLDEIPLLIRYFFDNFNVKYGLHKSPDSSLFRALCQYDYPGNVRELKNTIERLIITTSGDTVRREDLENTCTEMETGILSGDLGEAKSLSAFLGECERGVLSRILREEQNLKRAASRLGMTTTTLWRKMKKHSLRKTGESL